MNKWVKCHRCGGTGVIRTGHSYFTQDKCNHYHCVGGMMKNLWYISKEEMVRMDDSMTNLSRSALTAAKAMVRFNAVVLTPCPEILLPEGEDNITHEEATRAVINLNRAKLEENTNGQRNTD